MWYSFRSAANSFWRALASLVIATPLTFILGSVEAGDTSVEPIFESRIESNTNKDLSPESATELDSIGYVVDLAVLIDSRTPRSEAVIQPRLRLQEYPDARQIQNLEAFLDLNWKYRWQKSQLELPAMYSHQDAVNAEQPNAGFDEINPENPTNPESGVAESGVTRDILRVYPEFTHSLSQIWGLGASALYEGARYESDVAGSFVDYDYSVAEAFAVWSASERTNLRFGPYASKYKASDDSLEIDAYGVSVEFERLWSKNNSAIFSLYFEEDDIRSSGPTPVQQSDSGFGGELTLLRRSIVSRLRFVAGRLSTPSSLGVKTISDQVRLQYDRDLSQRLVLTGAARYVQDRALVGLDDSNDRDYFRGEFAIRYRVARDWFAGAGARFTWQEYINESGDADNVSFFVIAGYRGLGWRP